MNTTAPPAHKMFPYSEFFWSLFSRIRNACSVQMGENMDQKNFKYGPSAQHYSVL